MRIPNVIPEVDPIAQRVRASHPLPLNIESADLLLVMQQSASVEEAMKHSPIERLLKYTALCSHLRPIKAGALIR